MEPIKLRSGIELQPLQVTMREAAQLLAISRSSLYLIIRRGELITIGRGRLRRVAVQELRAWQAAHQSQRREGC